MRIPIVAVAVSIGLITACSGNKETGETAAPEETASLDACGSLCVGAGFDSGNEISYGSALTECTCAGGDGAIAQDDCSTYCDAFGVPPEQSYLSTSSVPDDKCVCDGTSLGS